MSTYKLTAADRRVLAQLQAKKASKPVYTRAAAARAAANSQTSGKKNTEHTDEPSVIERIGGTILDTKASLGKGVWKGLEGIWDFSATINGALLGLINEEWGNKVKEIVETDWVGLMDQKLRDNIGFYDDALNASYMNEGEGGELARNVITGVGQMLPAVAMTIATAGSGAPAAVSQFAGLLTTGASAAGNATEEAFNEGASYGEGLAYGAASGATEMALEKLLPGPADNVFGKAVLGKGAKEIASQGAKRVVKQGVKEAIGEGIEEMASEVTSPLRKSIYKGRDAFEEYKDPEFYKGVGKAGVSGALTSVAYGSTIGNMTKGKGYNGDIQASKDAIDTNKSNLAKLQGEKGKYSAEAEAQADANIEQNYRQIEAVLKKATPEKRAEYIERYELTDRFAEDGTLVAKAEDTSGIDKRYISADSRGQENRIKEALDREGVTAYHGELTDQESENLAEVYRAHAALSEYGFADKHVVIVNEMKGTNAYIDGNIIAIGKDMLTSGEHIKKLIHETTHFTEGSAEWAQVADFVFGKDASKVKTNLAKEISAVLDGGYGVTQADVDAVVEHIASGYKTKLTAKQGTLIEEVVANRMENLLGDSATIERICREKPSLAKRIWERIKALINSVGKSETEREEIKKLRETERLFRAALETGGQDYIRGVMEETQRSGKTPVVEILDNAELNELIANSDRSKYDVIRNYLIQKFKGHTFTLSDGRKAIMDNSDAQKLARNANVTRTAQLGNLKSLIENAIYDNSEYNVEHKKFIDFHYYTVTAKYNGDEFPLWINVGVTKNDGVNHIYAITNKKEDAPAHYGVGGPVGNHIQNASSNNSISQNPEKSTPEVKKSKKIQHSYAGSHSEMADKSKLFRAEVMYEKGIDSEEIRQRTGWFRGYDGRWRYEIDDSKLKFHNKAIDLRNRTKNISTLSKLIEHRELFASYPELREMEVIVDKTNRGSAHFNFKNSAIVFSARYLDNEGMYLMADDKTKAALLHEIQHAIQAIELTATGSSIDYWKQKIGTEIIAKNQPAIDDLNERIEVIKKEVTELGFPRLIKLAEAYRSIEHAFWGNQSHDEYRRREIARIHQEVELSGFPRGFYEYLYALEALDKKYKIINEQIEDSIELAYHRNRLTAGEIEARDVAKRLNLTAEERKNTRPDLDQRQVYFSEKAGLDYVTMEDGSEPVTSIEDEDMQVSEGEDYSEYDKPITLHDVEVLRNIGRKSINDFTSEEIKNAQKWAYKFYKELGVKSPFFRAWFGDWRAFEDAPIDKLNVEILALAHRQSADEYIKNGIKNKTLFRGDVKNSETDFIINIGAHVYNDTFTYAARQFSRDGDFKKFLDRISLLSKIKEITQKSFLFDTIAVGDSKGSTNRSFVHYFYSYVDIGGTPYLAKIIVDELSSNSGTIRRAYNVDNIQISPVAVSQVYKPAYTTSDVNGESVISINSISDLFDFVKTFDKNFKPKSVNEHFIDKETGLPKVFYLPENAGDWSNGITVYQNKRANAQPVYISSYFEDGVRPNFEIKDNGDVIVYDAGQVKSAADGGNIGTFDRGSKKIRYSRKSDTDGDGTKVTVNIPMANRSQFKIYTKENAEQIISSITHRLLGFNDGTQGVIKDKGELVDIIWQRLNTAGEGKRGGVALDVADEVINRIAVKVVYDDPNNAEYIETLGAIKEYLHGFNLDGIKGELEHRFGKNQARGIMLAWGAPKGTKGVTADSVAQELSGQGIIINAETEADCFFEIYDMFTKAREALKRRSETMLNTVIPENERRELKQAIAKEILDGFRILGKKSMMTTLIEREQANAKIWKEQYYDSRHRAKAIDHLFETVDRVRRLSVGKSVDSEIADEVKGIAKLLDDLKTTRGNLAENARTVMRKYAEKVGVQRIKLYNLISDRLDDEINPYAEMIEDIAHGNGELSTREIEALDSILRNFIHNANNYKRVFLDGKRVEATELIKQGIAETGEAMSVKDEGLLGLTNKMKEILQAPVWRFERLGCYRKNSVMMQLWREFQEGFSRQARFSMQVAEHYKEFFQKHKKEIQSWRENTYEIDGRKVSRGQMIGLYLTSLREQGRSHIFGENDNGVVRFANEKSAEKRGAHAGETEGFDTQISREIIVDFEKTLTVSEREFIVLTQTFFNEMSKNAKVETDEALYGVSNVVDANYYPLRVADDQIYRKLGDGTFRFADLFNLYSPSFNKATVDHANNKLVIENVIDVINRHAKQMSAYYGFARAVKTFNRVYNMKLENGDNMRSAIGKVDSRFEDYVGRLIQDIQGNRTQKNGIQRAVSKVRGWGAKAALGANLKVLASQFVSMPASAAVGVEYRSIAKGFKLAATKKTDYENMFEYCPMLYDRFRNGSNIDVGLLKEGRGVIGQLDWLTDLTTAPIGKIDALVCCAVWNACVEQTKNGSYEAYSAEHYREAAELTEQALIKTQANYAPLYRSEILRSQDSFVQMLTMFMGEPLQQFSLITSSVEKMRVTRRLAMNASEADKAEYEAVFKQAKSEAARALTAVFIDTLILTAITQLFKWIKGKEDEDKVKGIIGDFVDNYVGMIPIFKDVYNYIINGYDLTNMAYTGLTNVADGLMAFDDIIDLLASGGAYDEKTIRQKLRKTLLGISQTFGIPLRNLETYATGILEKIFPSAMYEYEALFYSKSQSEYSKELTKAIERGDDDHADTILGIMLDEKGVGVENSSVRREIRSLVESGYDVIPKGIGTSVNYDGELITLTKKQQNRFKDLYSAAGEGAADLVKLQLYRNADDAAQAKAIKFLYDTYYNLALEEAVGIDLESKNVLFAEAIDIEHLAIIYAIASGIEADKDRNGNSISGSRKAKIEKYVQSLRMTAAEKYLVMGYLGYKCKNGEAQVKAYVNRLKLTRDEKKKLLEYCGYAA